MRELEEASAHPLEEGFNDDVHYFTDVVHALLAPFRIKRVFILFIYGKSLHVV